METLVCVKTKFSYIEQGEVDQKFIKNGFANTKNSDKIEEGREI
jgi:hypothetical protein